MAQTSDEEREGWRLAATQHLAVHWTQPRNCPICASVQWTISTFGEIRYLQVGDDFPLGGPVFPVFFATCLVCGYAHVFNVRAAHLGPEAMEDREAREAAERAAAETAHAATPSDATQDDP